MDNFHQKYNSFVQYSFFMIKVFFIVLLTIYSGALTLPMCTFFTGQWYTNYLVEKLLSPCFGVIGMIILWSGPVIISKFFRKHIVISMWIAILLVMWMIEMTALLFFARPKEPLSWQVFNIIYPNR